jgi:hypothetical protein
MLIAALLCAAGAAVNWAGIQDPHPESLASPNQPTAAGAA